MSRTKAAQIALETVLISSSSQTGSELALIQSIAKCMTRNPIIQPSDLGANSVLPSIRSVFERTSISRGKMRRRESTPATPLSNITATKTESVPPEKPMMLGSPAMNSSNSSMSDPLNVP